MSTYGKSLTAALAAGSFILAAGSAGASEVSDYTIGELLAPCIEADNDAREGAEAETECEQYMTGFTDAFAQLADAAGEDVCLPEQNRPDEVRWAFMKWAMQNYGRRDEPAAEGLKMVLGKALSPALEETISNGSQSRAFGYVLQIGSPREKSSSSVATLMTPPTPAPRQGCWQYVQTRYRTERGSSTGTDARALAPRSLGVVPQASQN